jgi:hypothetical protein
MPESDDPWSQSSGHSSSSDSDSSRSSPPGNDISHCIRFISVELELASQNQLLRETLERYHHHYHQQQQETAAANEPPTTPLKTFASRQTTNDLSFKPSQDDLVRKAMAHRSKQQHQLLISPMLSPMLSPILKAGRALRNRRLAKQISHELCRDSPRPIGFTYAPSLHDNKDVTRPSVLEEDEKKEEYSPGLLQRAVLSHGTVTYFTMESLDEENDVSSHSQGRGRGEKRGGNQSRLSLQDASSNDTLYFYIKEDETTRTCFPEFIHIPV